MATLQNADLFVVQRPAGGQAGTYKIKWEEVLSNINAQGGSSFKGVADFTDVNDDPAPDRINGDQYINSTDGTFAWTNPSEANIAVLEGDSCFWSQDDGVWYVISSGGGGGGAVSSVDATAPLIMADSATIGDVIVESREASETQSGHVARLATDAEVAANGSGGENAVVTADQLRAVRTGATGLNLQAVTDNGSTTTNGARFAGQVDSGNLSTTNGCRFNPTGTIEVRNEGNTQPAFNIFKGGTSQSDSVATIYNDGRAKFANTVDVGNGSIELNVAQGGRVNADFGLVAGDFDATTDTEGVYIQGNDQTNGGYLILQSSTTANNFASFSIIRGANDQKVTISNDGTATFTGDVGIGGGPTFGSTPDYFAKQLNIYETGTEAVTGISFGAASSSNYIYAQNGTSSIDLAPENAVGIRVGTFAAGDFPNRVVRFSPSSVEIGGTLEEDDPVIKGNIILRGNGSAEFAGTVTSGPTTTSVGESYLTLGGNFDVGTVVGNAFAVYRSDNLLYASIKNDGSAVFAGTIQAGGYDFTNLPSLSVAP